MSQLATSIETTIENSVYLGRWTNKEYYMDLYYVEEILYKHRDGKYFIAAKGGAGTNTDRRLRWIDREEARKFLTDRATDAITGYHFTEAEADEFLEITLPASQA